jgi:hypothetical protein
MVACGEPDAGFPFLHADADAVPHPDPRAGDGDASG